MFTVVRVRLNAACNRGVVMSMCSSCPKHRNANEIRTPHIVALLRALAACAALALCGSAFAQGFPGGGGGMPGGAGMPGGHGPPPGDAGHRPPSPPAEKLPEPLESMLRTAHELRQSLVLNATQTQRWAAMQADLRDALDKRKAVFVKPADAAQVPNPPLLFIEDMATAQSELAGSLSNVHQSMQAAFDALDERQQRIFVEKMTLALRPTPMP
jgi:hypothetical protein